MIQKDVLEEKMEDDIFYAIGSGSTAKCISRRLGIDYELLGVDLVRNKKLVKKVGKENIQVIAPESKLISIPGHTLHVDCGDECVEKSLNGYNNVLCGYGYFHSFRCK